jgi:hypothetical protein
VGSWEGERAEIGSGKWECGRRKKEHGAKRIAGRAKDEKVGSGNAEVGKWTKLAGKLGGPDVGKFLPLAFHLLPFTLNLIPVFI